MNIQKANVLWASPLGRAAISAGLAVFGIACKTGSDVGQASAASAVTAPAQSLFPTEATPPRSDAVSELQASSKESSEPERKPDVIYVPTPQPVVDKMLELVRLNSKDLVYDLGCGDGRIVVTAAKRYGARAVGFDIDPRRVAEARENVRRNGVEELVRIEQTDIFTLDLSPASVVTLYLLPSLNVKLIPQLERMRPGSRIVSHDFDIEGVVPVQQLTIRPERDGVPHSIFSFEIPLKREPR